MECNNNHHHCKHNHDTHSRHEERVKTAYLAGASVLSLKQVSAKYDIPIRTLYHLISSGKLKTKKLGRKYFISENDLFAGADNA